MFLLASVILSMGRRDLYDITAILAVWFHVPSGGSLSLVPCSFQMVSVSDPMFLPGGVSVSGTMFLPGEGLPNKDPQRPPWTEIPCTLKRGGYAFYSNAFLFILCKDDIVPKRNRNPLVSSELIVKNQQKVRGKVQ